MKAPAAGDFDLRKAKGLGMRIIGAFRAVNGTVTLRAHNPGTEFIHIPREFPPLN